MGTGVQKYYTIEESVTIANGQTASTGFQLWQSMMFIGLFLPTMTNGNISLEVTMDDGANWHPVIDAVTGDQHVFCNTGQHPGFVDVSDYLRFLPAEARVRVVSAAAQGDDRTIRVLMRG